MWMVALLLATEPAVVEAPNDVLTLGATAHFAAAQGLELGLSYERVLLDWLGLSARVDAFVTPIVSPPPALALGPQLRVAVGARFYPLEGAPAGWYFELLAGAGRGFSETAVRRGDVRATVELAYLSVRAEAATGFRWIFAADTWFADASLGVAVGTPAVEPPVWLRGALGVGAAF